MELLGIGNNSTVFIGSRAAAAAAAATQSALREQEEKKLREAAAAEQKRRDALAIEAAIPQLNGIIDKALLHLVPSGSHSAIGGGGASAANYVQSVVELDELLQDICSKAEALLTRVPQLKSVEKVVEPCLQKLLEAINRNREDSSPVWLDDASPSVCRAFTRCPTMKSAPNCKRVIFLNQRSEQLEAASFNPLRRRAQRQYLAQVGGAADGHRPRPRTCPEFATGAR